VTKQIFISAGEISGDLHAGDRLKAEGVDELYHVDQLSTMGFVEIVRKLPHFRRVVQEVNRRLSDSPPDAAVLVDYPGMNFKFAERLNELKIPFVYYILPQVWAWHKSRIEKMKQWDAKFISILPFEPEFFAQHGLDVEYYGHPLIDLAKPDMSRDEFRKSISLGQDEKLIAVLPGSRLQEIVRILPRMLAGLRLCRLQGHKVRILCRPANPQQNDLVSRFISENGVEADIFNGNLHTLLSASDLALVASGTATVDTAICQTPAIVLYRTNWLTYLIARNVVTVKHIAMANLIAGETVYPELIQEDLDPGQISAEIRKILRDSAISSAIRAKIARIPVLLGEGGAYAKAAKRVASLVSR